MDASPLILTEDEQAFLGGVARMSIERALSGQTTLASDLPQAPTAVLRQIMGAFVTLSRHENLRGCIGNMTGHEPLYLTVAHMARAAAFEDPRFPPLQADEWPEVDLDISVLGPLSPCPNPERIEIGRHGLLLSSGGRSGVFLPQVPVEQGWNRLAYLEHLCRKAGLPGGSWKAPDAQLYWYEAFVFSPARQRPPADKREANTPC